MILRDSTNPFDIPLDGLDAVAGYGDGPWAWSSEGWARFPAAIVPLSIVIDPAHAGDVLDVERGDATPAACPGWADRFNRPGRRRPTIYCNRETIGAVRQAMAGRPFDWWAATLDGTLTGTDGAVAVQWKGAALTGGHYDESTVLDAGWIGGDMLTADEHTWLKGLFDGWFQQNNELQAALQKLDALAAAVAAVKPIDVDQLAADLVQHLPAGSDAQAVAAAVLQHLAAKLTA